MWCSTKFRKAYHDNYFLIPWNGYPALQQYMLVILGLIHPRLPLPLIPVGRVRWGGESTVSRLFSDRRCIYLCISFTWFSGVFSSKVDDFDKVLVISNEQIECKLNEEIPPVEDQIMWYLNGVPLNDETRVHERVLQITKEKAHAGIYQCFGSEKDYYAGKPYYVEIDESKTSCSLKLVHVIA